MNLFIPTDIYMEDDCVVKQMPKVVKLGKRPLIVTGKKSSRINGSFDDVVTYLESNNIEYDVYDDVEENPSVETVMKARDFGVRNHNDYVIGIGGGSPLDAAKAIALMICNSELDSEVLYQNIKLNALPMALIPTTAGTGSEVTPYSVLTTHKERTKRGISHRLFADIALLDHKYIKTQSYYGLAYTAIDALSHLIESYLNTNSNELNRIYSERGLRLFAKVSQALYIREFEVEIYKCLMEVSMLGGMAISHTGTSFPHGLSYKVTYEFGEPHGKAVGRYLADFLRLYAKYDDKEVTNVIHMMEMNSIDEFENFLKVVLEYERFSDEFENENFAGLMSNKAKLKNFPFELSK